MNDEQKQKLMTWGKWLLVVVLVAALGYMGIKYPVPEPPEITAQEAAEGGYYDFVPYGRMDNLRVDGDIQAATLTASGAATIGGAVTQTGAAAFGSTVTVTGAGDFASTLQYGTDNLYPLGYAESGYQIKCDTTSTFTETTTVSVSGLTTVTHVVALQITDPASTGAFLTVDAPTTSTVTFNSWETDATVGTTGVNAYYCAVGNQ